MLLCGYAFAALTPHLELRIPSPLRDVGFFWVFLGFKNSLCKIMQIPCKKQCLVLGRALDGAKMDPKKLLKSYEILAKNKVRGTRPLS